MSAYDTAMATTALRPTYAGDAAAWATHQAAMLRARRFDELDIEHLAAEIDDLAKREFDALRSALVILLVHMVKWDYQPWQRSRSWHLSIAESRRRIERRLRDNPSFRRRDEALADVWPGIVGQVLLETDMDRAAFPTDCPYDWDAILDRSFDWPQP